MSLEYQFNKIAWIDKTALSNLPYSFHKKTKHARLDQDKIFPTIYSVWKSTKTVWVEMPGGSSSVMAASFFAVSKGICQNIQSVDNHATDWTHNRYREVWGGWRSFRWECPWVVSNSPQSTDGRRCPQKHWTSTKTTIFRNRTNLFHSFETFKDQTKLNHDGRGR